MKDSALPEEKLLRLIRGTQKRETPSEVKSPTGAGVGDAKAASGQSLWQLVQHNLLFTRSYKLQKILLAAFILSCALFVVSLVYPAFYSANITVPAQIGDELQVPETPLPAPVKPLDYYATAAKSRQIFNTTYQGAVQQVIGPAGVELSKDINLLGIMMGAKPEAAVEDKKTNKVFYVSPGMFIGDYQIEEIQEGKVIVSRNGQRYELHL